MLNAWRPAQVRLAPYSSSMGQAPIANVPASPGPALIDSPVMAVVFDGAVGAGAFLLAEARRQTAKTETSPEKKKKSRNISYFFYGLSGLFALKLFLDGGRLGR